MITCAWCKTAFDVFRTNCARCGGPLPPPPGEDAGPPPPPAPRILPPGYRSLLLWNSMKVALIGMMFAVAVAIAVLLAVNRFLNPFDAASNIPPLAIGFVWGVPLALFLTVIAAACCAQALAKIRVLERGAPAVGRITKIKPAEKRSEAEETSWLVKYDFTAGGAPCEGVVTVRREAYLAQYVTGQPVNVLYMPDAPEINILYPPAD